MKRIGVLYGQERAFPAALISRIGEIGHGTVTAEPAVLDGTSLEPEKPYDLVLDRISHDVAFYRAVLHKYASDGVEVLPPPAAIAPTDRFQTGVLAARHGLSVPRRVVLPSREHPSNVTSESLTNLRFPLDWQRIFDHVGFPALLRPLARRSGEPTFAVTDPSSFFEAFGRTGAEVFVLEQALAGERYRCLVAGGAVRLMRAAPEGRYDDDLAALPPGLRAQMERASRGLSEVLGQPLAAYDYAVVDGAPYLADAPSIRPAADPAILGEEAFSWLVDQTAAFLAGRLGIAAPAPAPTAAPAAARRKRAKSAVAEDIAAVEELAKKPARKGARRTKPE